MNSKINYTVAIVVRYSDGSLKTILLAQDGDIGVIVLNDRTLECDVMNVSMPKAIEMLTQYYEEYNEVVAVIGK